jgi:hypothetical protein
MAEFWHDTYLMWEMLYKNGFKDENIHVLFADGEDFYLDNSWVAARYRPQWADMPTGFTITDGAATEANIRNAATELKSKMTEDDFLFVWTFDHGGYIGSTLEWHSTLWLLDDNGNGAAMDDVEFATIFNDSRSPIPANKKVYWMQQCFSGGFFDNLTKLNGVDLANVFFNSAARMTPSSRADDVTETGVYIQYLEKELINRVVYPHGEFNFHLFSSTTGFTPNPVPTDNYHGIPFTDADINGDGIISVEESAIWESTYESKQEVPMKVDPGNIGVHTSLKYPTLIHSNYHKYAGLLKGIMAVPLDLTVGTQDLVLPANSHTSLLDGKNITIANGYKLRVQSGAVLKINNGSKIKVEDGGQFLIEDGGKLLVEGSAVLAGNISAPVNSVIEVAGSGELHIQEISDFDFLSGAVLKLNSNSKLFVENGTDLKFNSGSVVEVYEDSEVIVGTKAYMTAAGTNFNYTGASGGKWFGINGLGGSSVSLDNVSISDAVTGVKGVYNYKFIVKNSAFENCVNGIIVTEPTAGTEYEIIKNTLTGTRTGTGVTITNAIGKLRENNINLFYNGVSLVMSSPEVAKNKIELNKRFGVLISGQNAIPTFINTSVNQVYNELNNTIIGNGNIYTGTDLFPSGQIGIVPYASIYMQGGRNNVYSGNENSVPVHPCISIDQKLLIHDNILIRAENNYWGSYEVTDDFFFGHPHYTIDYEPYAKNPFGSGGSVPTLSAERKLLENAMVLEEKGNYTAANKIYEALLKRYANTPEYYVTMARLPYLYAKAGMNDEDLISIYDEAYESENISHKKFFKGMKVATHIKGKRYDNAILIAEEMKAEAEFDEEIILADINIAIANMLKNGEGKGRSEQQDVNDLIAKLNGSGKEPLGNPANITESVLPSQHELFQNYPNPFNPVTQINFALSKTADVKLSVYNINGQKVAELANGSRQAGVHAVDFDGTKLNSGVYYYTLEANGQAMTKKMVLTK